MSSNPGAEALNVAVVRGIVSSDPKVRSLPSGDTVTNVEVTTRLESGSVSVPVVVHAAAVSVRAGDEVVVTGHVARRFFRAGGVTQSRTEVVADQVIRATRSKTVGKALSAAVAGIDVQVGTGARR
jgi:single-strand DNA-binding protein